MAESNSVWQAITFSGATGEQVASFKTRRFEPKIQLAHVKVCCGGRLNLRREDRVCLRRRRPCAKIRFAPTFFQRRRGSAQARPAPSSFRPWLPAHAISQLQQVAAGEDAPVAQRCDLQCADPTFRQALRCEFPQAKRRLRLWRRRLRRRRWLQPHASRQKRQRRKQTTSRRAANGNVC